MDLSGFQFPGANFLSSKNATEYRAYEHSKSMDIHLTFRKEQTKSEVAKELAYS